MELCRLRRERETTDEKEQRLARQREYMRQRRTVLTDQQREQILQREDKISMSGPAEPVQPVRQYSLTTFLHPCIINRSIYSNRTIYREWWPLIYNNELG